MNVKIAILMLASAATFPALAGENPVDTLSDVSGLSERKVQMILGNRTAFAEYRRTYDRALAQFTRAIGEENYDRLMQGEQVMLTDSNGRPVAVQLRKEDLGTAAL